MNGALAITTTVVALVAGGWCLVAAVRDRPPGRTHWIAVAVTELVVLVLVGAVIARLAGGDDPAEFGTFVGYLVTLVFILPLAFTLAMMERTRWGSTILCVGLLVVPVLVARLQQVWSGHA